MCNVWVVGWSIVSGETSPMYVVFDSCLERTEENSVYLDMQCVHAMQNTFNVTSSHCYNLMQSASYSLQIPCAPCDS